MVSVDSHVGPSVKDQLLEYCDPQHLDDFHRFVEEMEQHGLLTWRLSEAGQARGAAGLVPRSPPRRGRRGEVRQGRRHPQRGPGGPARFMQRSFEAEPPPGAAGRAPLGSPDMDAAGVAAAVIYHGGLNGQSIPFSTTGLIAWGDTRYNHLEPAGVRIYNRWLADFVAEAPDRNIGIASHPDLRSRGLCARGRMGGCSRPEGHQPPGPARRSAHAQRDRWEPLWAACEATGMSLNTHGGGGEHYPYKGDGAQSMYMMETTWRTRRGV